MEDPPESPFNLLSEGGTRLKSVFGADDCGESEPFTISGNCDLHGFELPVLSVSPAEPTEVSVVIERGGDDSKRRRERTRLKMKDGQVLPDFLKDKFDFDKLACKPLSEVDSEFYQKQTFLVIGKDGLVHRFSGKESIFILNPLNRLRELGIYLYSNWHLAVLIGISLCLFICFSFVLPNYSDYSLPAGNLTRYIFSLLLLAEICVNVFARGILVAEFTYLRSPWDWLDLILSAILILNIYWRNLVLHSLQGIALLKFIPLVPALKRGLEMWMKILKKLVPVSIYSLLIFWIVLILGFHNDNYEKNMHICGINETLLVQNQYFSQGNYNTNLPLSSSELNTFTGTFSGDNHTEGYLRNSKDGCADENNFLIASLSNITLQIMDLMTVKTFRGFQTQSNPLERRFLFVTSTIIFGSFAVGILTVAALGRIFLLERRPQQGKSCTTTFEKLINCLPEFEIPQCDFSALNQITRVLFHPVLEVFITFVICVDLILMCLSLLLQKTSDDVARFTWIVDNGQKVCLVVYVIEFALKLITDPFRYFRNRWTWLDFLVVLIYTTDKFIYPLKSILMIRSLKIVPRWPTLQLIMSLPFKVIKKQCRLIFVLFICFTAFEIISHRLLKGIGAMSQSSESWDNPFVFLFKDWLSTLVVCDRKMGAGVCVSLFTTEVVSGIGFVLMMFMSVIYASCDILRKPFEPSEIYQTLSQGLLQCCNFKCFKKSSQSENTNVTLNGGIKLTLPIPNRQENITETQGMSNNVLSVLNKYQVIRYVSVVVIFAGSFGLLLEFDPMQRVSPKANPRFSIDMLFTIYFLLLLLWRLIDNFKMMKSPSWLLDFLIITASGFTTYVSMTSKLTAQDLPLIKLIATLGSCRALMLISRLDCLKIAVIGITSQIRLLWRFLLPSLFLWLAFLLLRNGLSDKDEEDNEGVGIGLELFNRSNSSGSNESTLPLDYYSVKEKSIENWMMSCLWILIVVVICGVFVGLTFFQLMTHKLLYSFMTVAQSEIYKDKNIKIIREKTLYIPPPKSGLCLQIIHYMTQTKAFDLTVMFTILCDCLIITFSHMTTSKNWSLVWSHHKSFIILTYACELACKLIGWRMYFFKSMWNIFDSAIVSIGILDILLMKVQWGFVTADTIRFFRILRLFQVELFTKNAKLLEIFYTGFLKVVPCLGNLFALFLTLFYTYSAIGLVNFQQSSTNTFTTTSSSTTFTSLSSGQQPDFEEFFQMFKNISVSLLMTPLYGKSFGDFEKFLNLQETHSENAQANSSCWKTRGGYYEDILLVIYINSYLIVSYIIMGDVLTIILYEMVRGASAMEYLYAKTNMSDDNLASNNDNESEYPHINGLLVNCRKHCGANDRRAQDDPETLDTILTPATETANDDHTPSSATGCGTLNTNSNTVGDDEKYPLRMSANGYILHVEAIVTTV